METSYLPLVSSLATFVSLASAAIGVVFSTMSVLRKASATRHFERSVSQNKPSQRDLETILRVLRDIERKGLIRDAKAVRQGITDLDKRNRLVRAMNDLPAEDQLSIAEIIANPSDSNRKRYLEATLSKAGLLAS